MSTQQIINDNVRVVKDRVATAATEAGRDPQDVTIVAVTKYVDAELTQMLVNAGMHDLGENRPQQLWEKAASLTDPAIRWHQIGHLQRNKLKRTLPLVHLLHAGDSERLLAAANEQAHANQNRISVLLEVNISGDETKHGFTQEELADALPRIAELEHLEVVGLMGMASRVGGIESAQRDFEALATFRDKLRANEPPTVNLRHLSMGMSGDFEVAIREGATIVRIGSAFFDGVR